MTRWPLKILLGLALLTVGGVHLLGCEDDPALCRPEVPAGRFEGHVNAGRLGLEMSVVATRVESDGAKMAVFRTPTDYFGHYTLDVPAGRYTLELQHESTFRYDYSAAGLGYGRTPPDTLDIGPAHPFHEINFALGCLDLAIDGLNALDGEVVEVTLHRRNLAPDQGPSSLSDSGREFLQDGRALIRIPGVLPGDYQVEVTLHPPNPRFDYVWDGESFWLPDTHVQAEAQWVTVGPNELVELPSPLFGEPARLAGRVHGAWLDLNFSTPPILSLISPDSSVIIRRRGLDDAGRFEMDLFMPGPMKLMFRQQGLDQWYGGTDFDSATLLTPVAGQALTDLDLVQCGLSLEFDPSGPNFGEGSLSFYDPVDLRLLGTARAGGWEHPAPVVTNLWPGEFLVYFHEPYGFYGDPNWIPQWYDGADTPGEAQVITLESPGQILDLTVTLGRGGTLSGSVDWGTVVSDALVVTLTTAGDSTSSRTDFLFDFDTEFTVGGLLDGDYKLGAHPLYIRAIGGPLYPQSTVWYPGTSDWSEAAVIEIRDGGTVSGLDFGMN